MLLRLSKPVIGLIVTSAIVLDQLTKWIAETSLVYYADIIIIPKVLSLSLVHNYGAAYGILQSQRTLLIGVSIGVIVISMGLYSKIATTKWSQIGLISLWAGAIGNLIDRSVHGYVIDFINIHIIPVFNVADMLINLCVICFIIELITSIRAKNEV
jgi:signal peptidase II